MTTQPEDVITKALSVMASDPRYLPELSKIYAALYSENLGEELYADRRQLCVSSLSSHCWSLLSFAELCSAGLNLTTMISSQKFLS